jgi:hypothetical protein
MKRPPGEICTLVIGCPSPATRMVSPPVRSMSVSVSDLRPVVAAIIGTGPAEGRELGEVVGEGDAD